MSDNTPTPIDRPLMRSDVDAIRKAVQRIEQVALKHYTEATSARFEQRLLTAVCVGCVAFCFGCAIAVMP